MTLRDLFNAIRTPSIPETVSPHTQIHFPACPKLAERQAQKAAELGERSVLVRTDFEWRP